MYALGHNRKASAILYPTDYPEASEARIVIADPVTGADAAVVSLRPVNLPWLEELVTAGRSVEAVRRRQEYARQLVRL